MTCKVPAPAELISFTFLSQVLGIAFTFFLILLPLHRRALPRGSSLVKMASPSRPTSIQQGDKGGTHHEEVLHDHDLGAKGSQAEAQHLGRLTEEELVIEKKLRRKIDSLIMPLVILVSSCLETEVSELLAHNTS